MNTSADTTVWSPPSKGLRLGLSRDAARLRVWLENTGTESLTVLSHVVAGGVHLDWFELHFEDAAGGQRRLRFFADRDEAAPVRVSLPPGGRLHHDIAAAAWALQPVNGGVPLASRNVGVWAEYRVAPEEAGDAWSGSLRTPSLT